MHSADPETGKHYVFLTNHFKLAARTIAEIYRQRWQVELFFKAIKQNLKIKRHAHRQELVPARHRTQFLARMMPFCQLLEIMSRHRLEKLMKRSVMM